MQPTVLGDPLGDDVRKIPWSSLIIAAIVGAGLGYLTYVLNEDGFAWYSLFPGFVAFLMGVSIFGMLLPDQEAPSTEAADEDSEDEPPTSG